MLSVEEGAKALMLSWISKNYSAVIEEAKNTRSAYEEFLAEALSKEIEYRLENRIQKRIRMARLPYRKYLQDLELDEYEGPIRYKIEDLMTLDFIVAKENVILVSNPGRGKTHLAIGLGIAACLRDMRVLFTNVPNLVIELKEAMSRSEVTLFKRRFMGFDLVIIDELGYVSFDKEGNEILFNLLSNRNDTGSMIVTTNLSFEKWEDLFGDTVLAGALVDRLTHKAHVLDMSGDSYRFKETKQLLGK